MPEYIAPYLISTEQPVVPLAGTFTVPVCTTPERFKKIMDALYYGGLVTGETGDYDHLVDWLDACTRITEGCVDLQNICRTISPTSSKFTWFPENPYTPGDDVPDGYTFHPWTVADSSIIGTIISAWGLGYVPGDVYTDLTKFPIGTWLPDFIANLGNLPSFTINDLVGTGKVNIKLLNIPQGGRALIQIDDAFDLLNLQWVELNKDNVSIPQETQVPIIIEVPIETEGTHTVKVTFFPTVDDALIPVFFGGGIREIEICGFGEETMPEEACCDETNDLLTTNNSLLLDIVKLLQGGFKIVPINQGIPPDAIKTSPCAPFFFDADPDDTSEEAEQRRLALCYVVQSYITAVLVKASTGMGIPSTVFEIIFTNYASFPDALFRIYIDYPPLLTVGVLLVAAASAGTIIDVLTCLMLENLQGKINSFSEFKTSLDAITEDGIPEPLSHLVYYANQDMRNWELFNQALEQAFERDLSAFECPCDEPPTAPLDLIDPASPEFHNTLISWLGGNQYRFQQATQYPTGTWSVNIQSVTCQKLNFITGSGTAVSHWYSRASDCDTVTSDGTGGFAGETYQLGLDCDSPLDITFEIVLA